MAWLQAGLRRRPARLGNSKIVVATEDTESTERFKDLCQIVTLTHWVSTKKRLPSLIFFCELCVLCG
jgi:hypothetical protein